MFPYAPRECSVENMATADLQIRMYDFSREPLRQSNYAKRISHEEWQTIRPVVQAMFNKGMARKDILEELHTKYRFRPSMSQLVTQAMRWGLTRERPRSTDEEQLPSPWDKVDTELYCVDLARSTQPRLNWAYTDTAVEVPLSDTGDGSSSNRTGHAFPEKSRMHDFVFEPVGGGSDWEIAYFNLMAKQDTPSWMALCHRTARISRELLGKGEQNGSVIARHYILHSLQIALRSPSKVIQHDIALVYGMMYLAADASKRGFLEEARRHVEAACTNFQGTFFYTQSGKQRVFDSMLATLRAMRLPAMSDMFHMDFEAFLRDPVAKIPGI